MTVVVASVTTLFRAAGCASPGACRGSRPPCDYIDQRYQVSGYKQPPLQKMGPAVASLPSSISLSTTSQAVLAHAATQVGTEDHHDD